LKFVFAKSHALINPDWWLVLDCEEARIYCEKRMFRNTIHKNIRPLLSHKKTCDAAAAVLGVYSKGMGRMIASLAFGERDGWFANRVGGTCPDMHEILETVESDEWPSFVSNEELLVTAKFSKWPNGDHWYVRLSDGRDVEWDDECKWGTKAEALIATQKFLGLYEEV